MNSSFTRSYSLNKSIGKKNTIKLFNLISGWNRNIEKDVFDILKKGIDAINPGRPTSSMLMGSRHKHQRQVLEPFYNALKVPDQLGFKPKIQCKKILTYLEAYTLIIDCKKSALRISKDTWECICLRLLD